MTPSKLEKVSDRKLFHLIKILSKEIDIDDVDNSVDNDFQTEVQSVCKLFNIEPEYVDEDYIFNLWKMNEDIFEGSVLTLPLKRPKLKIYEIEWEATFRKISTEKYRLKEPMYTQDMEDVRNILWDMRANGWLDIFEGDLIEDYDSHSEMTDDDILDIKPIN
jgi:hypothetical protein